MDLISEYPTLPTPSVMDASSEERTRWPRGAAVARDSLLRDLNSWSRDHDWPSTLNSWIADEAVRRAY